MARFDRVYSLVIGSGGQQGVEINSLRIVFDVSKDDTKNPNRSTLKIYNLAPQTREALEKTDVRCIFKAGYGEEDGPIEIYQGDVAYVFSRYDRADVVTTVELGEGAKAIRDVMVSLSYNTGVTSNKILNDLAGKLKMAITMPLDIPSRSWQNGLSYHGAARQALDKVCAATGLSWSVQGGALQIIKAGGNTNRTVVDLAADSGLLGSPERVRKGSQEVRLDEDDPKKAEAALKAKSRQIVTTTQEEDGWRVRSLLLPSLLPGDRVKLSSRTIQGVFTIRDLRHAGDTHGGDWFTELKVVATAAGAPEPATAVRQSNTGGAVRRVARPATATTPATTPRLDFFTPE